MAVSQGRDGTPRGATDGWMRCSALSGTVDGGRPRWPSTEGVLWAGLWGGRPAATASITMCVVGGAGPPAAKDTHRLPFPPPPPPPPGTQHPLHTSTTRPSRLPPRPPGPAHPARPAVGRPSPQAVGRRRRWRHAPPWGPVPPRLGGGGGGRGGNGGGSGGGGGGRCGGGGSRGARCCRRGRPGSGHGGCPPPQHRRRPCRHRHRRRSRRHGRHLRRRRCCCGRRTPLRPSPSPLTARAGATRCWRRPPRRAPPAAAGPPRTPPVGRASGPALTAGGGRTLGRTCTFAALRRPSSTLPPMTRLR